MLQHDPYPKHLGVFLDRTLSIQIHIIEARMMMSHRNSIIGILANTSLGATPCILRLSCGALCLPNKNLRIIPECLKSSQTHCISTFSYVARLRIRRKFVSVKRIINILKYIDPILHDIINYQIKSL
ncbi:hypothetical protein RF11_09967 [Thelohanellus kitauei]|uniref:Uncharacterized protein n=1 Tax=Thelohanellus kitauei TaxID=669202 RepID=A0A0C2IYZ4_THEKT|nr:hypothetical protein RF11_09967 [Thelohanellus kitauei]